MTKAEIRSLITNILPRVDKTRKYHPNVVDAAIERAFNQAFSDIYFRNPLELDNYTKTYDNSGSGIAVSTNSDTNIKSSTIPADYIPLPDRASGVRNIYTVATGGTLFYPISSAEFDLISHSTHTSTVTDAIGYVVRGGTVEYYGMSSTVATAGVRMDILIPFRTYADSDNVLMPFSRDVDLVKQTLEIMGIVPPVDLEDTNADRKVVREQ